MRVISELLPGALLLDATVVRDARGGFVKTFHAQAFASLGCHLEPAESFYSYSKRGVVRGLHFQVPPRQHSKLVYCTRGAVFDVLVDLRSDSGTYGRTASIELSSYNYFSLFVPAGIAHGFCALEEETTMIYVTDREHSPEHDSGIRWDSVGVNWPVTSPILSSRDAAFPRFEDFASPF